LISRSALAGPALVAAIFLGACGSNASVGSSSAALGHGQAIAASPHPIDGQASAPAPSGQEATTTKTTTSGTSATSSPARSAPNPPRPPLPPFVVGHAPRIALCGPLPIALPPQPVKGLAPLQVCGSGFSPVEVVTLTLRGRFGTTSWTVNAAADGSFQSTLFPGACRYAPGLVVARGNRGHVSNPLLLPPCRPGI
jgi:hypothetical protein